MKYDKGHPAAWRAWLRQYLPWFLIDLGLADKIADCEEVGGWHRWYCIDERTSGCYHCKVQRAGQLWKADDGDT